MTRKGHRPCQTCGRNRAERFFSSARAKNCVTCRKKRRSKTTHESRVQSTYGLGPGEYDELVEAQGGVCAICRQPRRQRLSVDHDHKTGFVRGAACRLCNGRLLTAARDNPEILRNAARYLEDPPAIRVIGYRKHPADGKPGAEMEIWRPVPGYDGWYECSTLGRVRSWKGQGTNANHVAPRRDIPLILKDAPTRGGYRVVGLSKDGEVKSYRVNRLVLITFEGGDQPDLEACHNNGDRTDNRLSNLRWGTPKENSADKALHGTQVTGEDTHSAKLTKEKVIELRMLWATGQHTVEDLANRFGVSGPTAWKAATGKTWRRISYFPPSSRKIAVRKEV